MTTRLAWDGAVVRSPPKNFGAIGDGHAIKFGEPWGHSIEHLFQHPDDNMPFVVDTLMRLEAHAVADSRPMQERLHGYDLPEDFRRLLGECLVSLIVRSPNFRNKMRITTDHWRQGLPYRDNTDAENLVVANMNQSYASMVKALQGGGRYIVMLANGKEFIFGQGFLSNVSTSAVGTTKCLVPLTPNMALGFFRPMSYRTLPNVVTIRLSDEEVGGINMITQVYTKDYLYYRRDCPEVGEAFKAREFLMYDYHNQDWLDWMLGSATEFYDRSHKYSTLEI